MGQTLIHSLFDICHRASHKTALIDRGETSQRYSFAQVENAVVRIASWLKDYGLRRGDKVGLVLENGPQWVFSYFGILLAGGVCVPLDSQFSLEDIVHLADDAQLHFLFLERALYEKWQKSLSSLKVRAFIINGKIKAHLQNAYFLDEILSLTPTHEGKRLLENIASCDETASILYSSGTTSDPKGVELTHRNFLANFEGIQALEVCSARDIFLSILPLFHAYAFMGTLIVPFFSGASIVYVRSLQSDELVKAIKEEKVTIVVGVPEVFQNIYRSIQKRLKALGVFPRTVLSGVTNLTWFIRRGTGINLNTFLYAAIHNRFGRQLRYFVSGGAALDPEVAYGLQKAGFSILEGYGLTETAPIVTLNPPQRPKIGSVGKPLENVEVRIKASSNAQEGEILIRGDNVMKGYYRRPDLTQEVIKEGWFHSGDIGYLDKEGYLHITGRKKEIIVLSSGKNIFPEEIEKIYSRAPAIKEIGVFYSHLPGDEGLKAIVVPNPAAFKKTGEVNIRERIQWEMENIAKTIPAYKRIMGFVVFREELPKTRLGKIKHYQLEEIYGRLNAAEERPTEEDPIEQALLQSDIGQKIKGLLKTELHLQKEIHARDHLELTLGIDSLTRVELIAAAEKAFQIRIPDEVLVEIATVGDLISKIVTLKSSGKAKKKTLAPKQNYWQEILLSEYSKEHAREILLNPNFFNRWVGYLLQGFLFLFFKRTCRLKILGQDNLPAEGPYILASNHSSYLDAFVIIAGLRRALIPQTYFAGTREIFHHPLIRRFNRFAHLIAVDPSTELIKAMQAAGYVLRHGKILCIFPEGQRSIDGQIKKFKKGVGILMKELKVPVVPVAIRGTYEAWPRGKKWPRPHTISVCFGEAISGVEEISLEKPPREAVYEQLTEKVREAIRGCYNRIT